MGVCGKQRFFTLFPVFGTNKNRFQLEIMGEGWYIIETLNN